MLIWFEKTKTSWREWIFVRLNDSLCSYYKMLWRKCKKLWSSKYIHAFWVFNGTLRLKLTENGRVHMITHSQDLDELFPEDELLRGEEQWVPCSVCLVYFHWVYGFLRLFYSSGVLIFMSNILAAILFFYLLLYTAPIYFIYIFVSIVTQHMLIYESCDNKKLKKSKLLL